MVGIEGRVHKVRIGISIGLFRQQHSLYIVRRFVSAVHDIDDKTVQAGKGKIEQGIDPAAVEPGNRIPVRPGFSDKIAVRVNASAGLCHVAQELRIGFRIPGKIGGHRVQAESVGPFAQPEGHDVPDLIADCLACQVQIRHFRPESGLVVPVCAFKRRVSVLGLPGEIVIVIIPAVGTVRLPVGRELPQVIGRRLEPFVVIRGMIQHQIHIQADAPLVAVFHQSLKILHGPESRIYRAVIIHVVLMVGR